MKDLVLVDAALNDSILSPDIQTTGEDTSDDPEVPSAEVTSGMDTTNRLDIPDILEASTAELSNEEVDTVKDAKESDEEVTTSKDVVGTGLPNSEMLELIGPENRSDLGPERITHTETSDAALIEQGQPNNVRRSQRIKERQGQTLDLDLIGENDDPADPNYQ